MNAAHRKARAHGRLCAGLAAKGYPRAAAFHEAMMRRRQAEAAIERRTPEAIQRDEMRGFLVGEFEQVS